MKTELSLQKRITLWSTIVVTLIIIAFIFLVTTVLKNRLERELDRRLVEESKAVSLSINYKNDNIYINESIEWREPHHQDINDDAIFLTVLDEKRNLVRHSENFPYTPELIQNLTYNKENAAFSTRILMSGKYRFLVMPFQPSPHTNLWIIIGKSYQNVQHILKVVFTAFLFIFPVALLLVYGGSTFLARKSLQPVRAISEKARHITSSQLSQRLPIPPTDDDITHLATTLNDLLDRLETSMENLRDIAANASHEIKTPVTILHTYLDRWSQSHPKLNDKEILHIRRELHRITKIIDNLSQIAKTSSGVVKLQFDTVWMNDLLYEEIERFRSQAVTRNTIIRATSLPSVSIKGDVSWLHLAIGNLIENALKYSPDHTQITVEMDYWKNQKIVIRITDEGPGVPEKDLPKLTSRYFRSKQSRSHLGTGLGLSIAHWVTQQHNGELHFQNNPSGGLTVQVLLPKEHNSKA